MTKTFECLRKAIAALGLIACHDNVEIHHRDVPILNEFERILAESRHAIALFKAREAVAPIISSTGEIKHSTMIERESAVSQARSELKREPSFKPLPANDQPAPWLLA